MPENSAGLKQKLIRLGQALVDQEKARIIVSPAQRGYGYWFGGGNIVTDNSGTLYSCGRYRNAGDSRVGIGAGARGFELAIFSSRDGGKNFEKRRSFSKSDLSHGQQEVISIERSWINTNEDKVELYISTEKAEIPYPKGLEHFKKANTGVWTIDIMEANSIETLDPKNIRPLLRGDDPRFYHFKDPFVFTNSRNDTVLVFCTHPFNWTSSNAAYAVRPAGATDFGKPDLTFFPRGFAWDVAISRLTNVLHLPPTGILENLQPVYLCFYDGGESIRNYEEHAQAVKRPRGYSCEELGGLGFFLEEEFPSIERLSINLPMFISPYGTGCSRYFSTLSTEDGIYTSWMQSQEDLSQPLVLHFLSMNEVKSILR